MSHPGVELVTQLIQEAGLAHGTIEERRAALEATAGAVPAPDGVTCEPLTLGGRPAERIAGDDTATGDLVYLHGGGYVSGSLGTHRNLAGRLALSSGCTVWNLDYRLGPEHPFPAAVDDVVAAVRDLVDRGSAAGRIAVAGDSAGGGLALAALVALRDGGGPLPGAGVGLSPWTDLTQSGSSYETRAAVDPMVTADGLNMMAAAYLAGADPGQPLASPLHADLRGLPPIMLEVGDAEVLLDDATTFADRARAAGVDVTLTVWPEMLHVFQAFPGELLPESDRSVAAIGEFLRARLR